MSNLPALFSFEGQEVRIIDRDGNPWLVLADVCRVLEHSNPSKMAEVLDEDEKSTLTVGYSEGGPDRIIISEPGLYKLLETSRKPVAKRFNRWVRHEVLPSIRKTGGYGDHIVNALAEVNVRFDFQDREIADLKTNVARVNGKIDYVSDNVAYLSNTLMPRRPFSASAWKVWRTVVSTYFGGHCPCGCGDKILDRIGNWVAEATEDHFYSRNRNKLSEGWPTLEKCNQRLRDPKERTAAHPAFSVFQGYCEKVAARILSRKTIRRRSKTTSVSTQTKFPF